jgi:hypothetical protein
MTSSVQEHLSRRRSGHTTAVTIDTERFYLTANQRDDGSLGEVFIHWGKHGTSSAGLVSTYAIALSTGLAHRVPLTELLGPGLGQYFTPNGRTDDPEIPRACSAVDYIARRLAIDWLPYADRAALGVFTLTERVRRWELTVGSGLRVQTAQEVAGRLHGFLPDLLGHGARQLERGVGRVLAVGVPAGGGFDRQVRRDVHAEVAGLGGGDVPQFVPPHRLPAQEGGQREHDAQLGVYHRHRRREEHHGREPEGGVATRRVKTVGRAVS